MASIEFLDYSIDIPCMHVRALLNNKNNNKQLYIRNLAKVKSKLKIISIM